MNPSPSQNALDKKSPDTNETIGIALWLIEAPTLRKRVEWAAQNDFEAVSFLESFLDCSIEEKEDAAAAIREYGLQLSWHANVSKWLCGEKGIDDAQLKRLLDEICWWHDRTLGVRSLMYDPVVATAPDGTRSYARNAGVDLIMKSAMRLGSMGIFVGLENGFGPASYSNISDFCDVRQACPVPNLGMLLDVGHANIHVHSSTSADFSKKPVEYILALPFPIIEVHVSDNSGVADEHRAAGCGNVNLENLFRAIRLRGFAPQITVEVCIDILKGKYAARIDRPEEFLPILQTRDAIFAALKLLDTEKTGELPIELTTA